MATLLKAFLGDAIKMHKPKDSDSFLVGFVAGAEAFAVWKDGQQVLGCGTVTPKELREVVREFVGEGGRK